MLSTNLKWREVATYQNNSHTAINVQRGDIDASFTEEYSLVGDVTPTLTLKELGRSQFIIADGTQTGDISVTIPAQKKLFLVDNSASSYSLDVIKGSTTISLIAGARGIFYSSADTNDLVIIAGINLVPIDASFKAKAFMDLPPDDNELIFVGQPVNASTLLSNANGLVAYATLEYGGDNGMTINILKNGSTVGTIVFTAFDTTGVVTVSSDTAFAAGDRIGFKVSGTADVTAYGLSIAVVLV